jgi:hypothetical protein
MASIAKGGRIFRNTLAGLTCLILLVAGSFLLPPAVISAGLTDVDLGRLKQAGLSEDTFVQFLGLYEDGGRKRPPSLQPSLVEQMIQAGFGDDLIRMFILLDRLTGDKEKMPVSPEAALSLARAGAGFESIWLLVGSEIALAGGTPKVDSQPPPTPPVSSLGRDVVVKPDGRKVVLYRSGNPDRPVEEVHTDQDGKKWLIYRAGGADIPPAVMDPLQQSMLDRALEHLEVNISVYPSR